MASIYSSWTIGLCKLFHFWLTCFEWNALKSILLRASFSKNGRGCQDDLVGMQHKQQRNIARAKKNYSNVSCNKVHIYINRADLIALRLGLWIDVGNNCPHIFQCQRTCGRLCRPQNPDLKLVVALFCHCAVRCAPYNTISRSKWTQSSTPRYHLITGQPTIRIIVPFDDLQVVLVAWGGSHLHPRALSLDSPYCKSPDITMNGRQ